MGKHPGLPIRLDLKFDIEKSDESDQFLALKVVTKMLSLILKNTENPKFSSVVSKDRRRGKKEFQGRYMEKQKKVPRRNLHLLTMRPKKHQ